MSLVCARARKRPGIHNDIPDQIMRVPTLGSAAGLFSPVLVGVSKPKTQDTPSSPSGNVSKSRTNPHKSSTLNPD